MILGTTTIASVNMLVPGYVLLLSIIHSCLGVDLTYNIQEGKSPGTFIGDISADTHLLDNIPLRDHNLITFTLLQQNATSSSQLFRVSKQKGRLYTAQILDAESICKRKMECFKMVDVAVRKAKSFMRIVNIKVIIEDVNDNEPEFPEEQIDIQFSEGVSKGLRKSIPNAIDRDVGALNSKITYELKRSNNEPFSLSVRSIPFGTPELSISVEEKLDREIKDSYMIQVIAKDGGIPQKQSILDVHITVTDLNDNPPVFTLDIYNVSIKNKDYGDISIVVVSATDLDAGENGHITYHFSPQTSKDVRTHFELDEVTGDIYLRHKLPSNQNTMYKLFVTAIDGGDSPLSGLAVVLVNVINTQNRAPNIFVNFVSESTGNTAAISEDIEVGSFIAYVKVIDYDIGQNGEVNCDLQHEKYKLESLGKKKYKIIVKNPVDRETEDHHDISIVCQDKGSPPLHSESRFSIKVMDANDVRPQFSKETFKFSIRENQRSNYPVGFINATDPDLGFGGKLTYSLVTTNTQQFLPFQISENGQITTVISLDHEFQDIYKFRVWVKDNGIPSLNNSVSAIVEVRDENDNAPYFTFPSVNPYTMDIVYYPHRTKNITVLKAADSDSQENAFLKYDLIAGNDKQLFTINQYTGLLSFTRVVNQQDAGPYDLEFMVKDSGTPVLSATTTMFLKLTVSNKTTEMLNAVNILPDDKIQLYLVIVIVLVSVTVSVPITAVVSISIIRYNDHGRTADREDMNPNYKSADEQRHVGCSRQSTHSQSSGGSVTVKTDSEKVSRTLPARPDRGEHSVEKISHGCKSSSLGAKAKTTSDDVYEGRHRGKEITGKRKNEQGFRAPDSPGKIVSSYHNDGGHGRSKGNTRCKGEFPDLYTSRYCGRQCTSLTDQPTQKKLVLQTFSCPRDSSGTTSKCVYKSDVGHITGPDHSQMPSSMKPQMAADSNPALLYSQPRKLKDRKTSAPTPDPEPQSLPSLPQVPHSDRPRQGYPLSEKTTAESIGHGHGHGHVQGHGPKLQKPSQGPDLYKNMDHKV